MPCMLMYPRDPKPAVCLCVSVVRLSVGASVCLCVYLSVCLSVCLSDCLVSILVRMYVSMYGCMYACIYVCMHVCIYVVMKVCMHVCMYLCVPVCVYVFVSVCMDGCMYVCLSICVPACKRASMHVGIFQQHADSFLIAQAPSTLHVDASITCDAPAPSCVHPRQPPKAFYEAAAPQPTPPDT